MKSSKSWAAAAVVGAATSAAATPVTVSESMNLNQFLAGGSTTLQFDLSATLAANGLFAGNVLSGNLVVYGVSDASYGAGQTQYGAYQQTSSAQYVAYYAYGGGGYYVCTSYSSWSGCNGGYYVPAYYYPVYGTNRTFERTADTLHADTVADQIVLAAGSSSASDTDHFIAPTYSGYGSPVYEGNAYNNSNGSDSYYRREENIYQGYSGDLNVGLGLDSVALADFASDGVLGADVTASVGQFRLTRAVLTLQVDNLPANSVPEPGTLALAGAAIGAGAVATRRRRRAAQ